MTYDPFGSGDFGASPFDEIFARMFGHAVPGRPAQRIDIGQLLTEQARERMRDAAKRALLDARQISRAFGSSYIGPEHLLFALAVNPDSAADRVFREFRVTPEALRDAALGAGPGGRGGRGGAGAGPPSGTPTVDE